MAEKIFTSAELYEAWPVLSLEERVEGFEFLKRDDADDFFLQLNARDRAELLLALPPGERRLWMRLLAPDDAADVIQEAPAEERESMLSLLDDQTRREVKGLLDYAEDEAGGLMNTRYSRLRADMTVDEAISYLRKDARMREKNGLLRFCRRCSRTSARRCFVPRSARFSGRKACPGRDAHGRDLGAGRLGPRSAESAFHAPSSVNDAGRGRRRAHQRRGQRQRHR